MKVRNIFEVQKNGVTVQWTDKIAEAQSAFAATTPGRVVMYEMDRSTGVKKAINSK